MELTELTQMFAERVLDVVSRTESEISRVLPIVVGIKNGDFVSSVKFGTKKNPIVSSLATGFYSREFGCDALLYAGECLVRNYTIEELTFMWNNLDTESPDLYPKSMMQSTVVFGSINFRTDEHDSYLVNKNTLDSAKKFSVGICSGFCPKLFKVGYKAVDHASLVIAMDEAINLKNSMDLVVIEREGACCESYRS
jgi:hypothetical protein